MIRLIVLNVSSSCLSLAATPTSPQLLLLVLKPGGGPDLLLSLQARRNREIAILQRKIDEVPSRAELTQYQKRFVELYSQGGF